MHPFPRSGFEENLLQYWTQLAMIRSLTQHIQDVSARYKLFCPTMYICAHHTTLRGSSLILADWPRNPSRDLDAGNSRPGKSCGADRC